MAEDADKYLSSKGGHADLDRLKFLGDKKWVWVADKHEGFVEGSIISETADSYTVDVNGSQRTINKDDAQKMNPAKFEKCEDMAALGHLNEASVLHNLRTRYYSGLIYTYSGLFCVVINPYRRLPIYTKPVIEMYKGKRRDDCPPHVYSITDNGYQDMLQERADQSILITGESGAGKTENTKKVIQYFAAVAPTKKGSSQQQAGGNLEDQIVQANPILEAFGNAKTIRNDNSSRFGKFIRVHFDTHGFIAGADIEHYLLEKSRVVKQSRGERNYHIFYHLMSANQAFKDALVLGGTFDDYKYLKNGDHLVDGVDDADEYALVVDALNVMAFSHDETSFLWRTVASVLHFGNVTTTSHGVGEQASMPETSAAERVCHLLGIPLKEFIPALLKPRTRAGSEWITLQQTVEQVEHGIDALSKALYDRVFRWLVTRINKTLETRNRRQNFIGVLDISGFEIFQENSFEQLCINHTNEKLQQFFNHHMFELEQQEYRKEGIEWNFIDFGLDLQGTIDLIEKKMGILELLDEACLFPKSTDTSLLTKLCDTHLNKSSKFGKPAFKSGAQREEFFVVHYAGTVNYTVAQWLDKNRDPLNDNIVDLLKKSSDPIVQKIWSDRVTDGDTKRKKGAQFRFVGQVHKEGLTVLMTTLTNTTPHFVRCIIPNEQKKAGLIDANLVLHQLRCNGVLEGIRICRQGFPNRIIFQEFRQRYEILAPGIIPRGFMDGRVAATKLVEACELDKSEYRIGHTKIFFRAGVLATLEDRRDEMLSAVMAGFQARCRGYLARRIYHKLTQQRVAIRVIQRNIRNHLAVRNWPWWRLFTKVKPLLNMARQEDEMRFKEEELERAIERAAEEERFRKDLEAQLAKNLEEKQALYDDLNAERQDAAESDARAERLEAAKLALEKQLMELERQLEEEEDLNVGHVKNRKRLEAELEDLRTNIETERRLAEKLGQDKLSTESNLSSIEEELRRLTDALAKMTKEKRHVDERLAETTERLQKEEDSVNSLTKKAAKLESSLNDTEKSLEEEKKERSAIDQKRRTAETSLKDALDEIDDLVHAKQDLEDAVKRKDAEVAQLSLSGEDSTDQILALQKEITRLKARIDELEDDLETERAARKKAEKNASDLSNELNDISNQLEEEGGAKKATQELTKKREDEIARLKSEFDDLSTRNETEKAGLRKKMAAAADEAADKIASLSQAKSQLEKIKSDLEGETVDLAGQLDDASKAKAKFEKQAKALQQQLDDTKMRADALGDDTASKEAALSKLRAEVADLSAQLLDAESKLGASSKARAALEDDVEEMKRAFEDDSKSRLETLGKVKRLETQLAGVQDQVEEEEEARSALQAQLSSAQQELTSWKNKYEVDVVAKVEEIETQRKKMQGEMADLNSTLEETRKKLATSERTRKRLAGEVEDATLLTEQLQLQSTQLEKKQKKFDASLAEQKRKVEELEKERDDALAQARASAAQLYATKSDHSDTQEQLDQLKKDKRHLENEIEDLTEQLGAGGKSKHETDKAKRNLELEHEELKARLEELEDELQVAESTNVRLQVDLTHTKSDLERRLQEKDEKFEDTRKSLQRQLDAAQESLEHEQRGRSEAAKAKKRLEAQIAELEANTDVMLRQTTEAQKQAKKYQTQLKEALAAADDTSRTREVTRELQAKHDKLVAELQSDLQRAQADLDSSEKARKAAEIALQDVEDQLEDKVKAADTLADTKRRLETEIANLQDELEDEQTETETARERAARSAEAMARLESDMDTERMDHARVEKQKKTLEKEVADLKSRLEEMDGQGRAGGKRAVAALETKVRGLQGDLDATTKQAADASKASKKAEKKLKELMAQMEDERRANDRLQEQLSVARSTNKQVRADSTEHELSLQTAHDKKMKLLKSELEEEIERADDLQRECDALRTRLRTMQSMPVGDAGDDDEDD